MQALPDLRAVRAPVVVAPVNVIVLKLSQERRALVRIEHSHDIQALVRIPIQRILIRQRPAERDVRVGALEKTSKDELPTIAREVDVVRRFARASWRAGHRSATDAARVRVGSRDAIARDHPAMRRALAREVRWIAFLLSVWRL